MALRENSYSLSIYYFIFTVLTPDGTPELGALGSQVAELWGLYVNSHPPAPSTFKSFLFNKVFNNLKHAAILPPNGFHI